MTRYHWGLLLAFFGVWAWSAIHPWFPRDYLLENVLVLIFAPIVLFFARYFRLSNLSYLLITLFMILHLVGAHYTYAEVPFGYTLQSWLGANRNMYDRLVHFSFGFLMAYPIREVFMRLAKTKGIWSFYLPFDVTLAFSAVYEIFEWLIAVRVDPASGLAFLGSQGDVWDTQKDMLSAGVGAALAMLVIALINWRYNPNFAQELKDSFSISPGDEPLGESLLRKWIGDTRR
jgi:putative membrane protein